MAVPAALWIRRALLARRYGSGLIPPEDVAVITADLHAKAEPRDLLDKAARMVAAASGSTEARIVLGEDDPSLPSTGSMHPLEVGGDRVGALLIDSRDPKGGDPPAEVVAQLLPTVALVARAVGLAVEAEHARRDVARERDAERRRVLGDLHDGLGPVLAGMSMRVQAALRTATAPEQADCSLTSPPTSPPAERTCAASSPASPRRCSTTATSTPRCADSSVLRERRRGPQVSLDISLGDDSSPAVQVADYRSVAEGITNALRHASATSIAVGVRADAVGSWSTWSTTDVGGPVVPGVGLSSLAQRAESLGGHLRSPRPPGTTSTSSCPADGRGAS